MSERGDWLIPTVNDEVFNEKPILYYWTALLGYGIFGVGELGARAGPAVAGLLAVEHGVEAEGLERPDPARLAAHAARFDEAAFQAGIAEALHGLGLRVGA